MTEVVAVPPERAIPLDIDLLRGMPDRRWQPRHWYVASASLGVHLLFFLLALHLPSFATLPQPERRVIIHHTKLYLPPDLLTQRAPNKRQITKNIDLAGLLATNAAATARPQGGAPSRRRFEVPALSPKPTAQHQPQILPDAPQVPQNQQASVLPPGSLAQVPAPAPPPPKPADSPFQNVGPELPAANPSLKPPSGGVEGAIRGLATTSTGRHLVVTDDNAAEPSPGSIGSPGLTTGPHAAVELQSDPQGADFRAYLTRILALVRANWRRVIPESARMGTLRGRTTVEFIVNRDGSIPKLVIASSSGSDPLDRAAGAGLAMSNPLPPLPSEYRGFQIRLAFTFSYNLPAQ